MEHRHGDTPDDQADVEPQSDEPRPTSPFDLFGVPEPAHVAEPETNPDAIWGDLVKNADEVNEADEQPSWWQRHADRWKDPDFRRRVELIPKELRPAPFRAEVAELVPSYGTRGRKATGAADLGREVAMYDSGGQGPALELSKPRRGMHGNVVTHAEAHTAAKMRQDDVRDATLYINRAPCVPLKGKGCEYLLPFMLRPGDKLTLYGPDGYMRVFAGRPEQ